MNSHISSADRKELLVQFNEKQTLQFDLQAAHEQSGSCGLAYLALWVVTESFAKQLWLVHQKAQLQVELREWLEFMETDASRRPSEISTSKYRPDTFLNGPIPAKKFLTLAFPVDKAPQFYMVLDPDKKYRIRRNSIAHSGDNISTTVYEEFKVQAMAAISEIEAWLQSKQRESEDG